MPLYTEKTREEALRPLAQYGGNDAFVKGQIYSMGNGGDMYNYSNNLKSYSQALEDAKANDNDNFFTGIGDFFVGRGADKLKADMADEYVKAYSSNPYEFAGNDYNENAGKIRTEQDLGQGRAFNGGLIGSLINPITQVGKAGADLGAGIGGNWDAWNKRDHLSDIGALGETALTLAPFAGAGMKALKGGGAIAKAGANTLGKTMLKGAGYGAGYSLAGGLKDMGSENFNGGELALNTLLGGAVGAGMSGIGYGLGKAWNKYTSSVDKDAVSKRLSEYAKGAGEYQDKLNILKNEGLTGNKEELSKAFDVWSKARENHPNSVSIPRLLGDGNTQVSKAEAENIYQQLVEQAMKEKTDRLNKVTNAFNYVKEKELPSLDLSSIPRKKASSISEGLSNIKNNLFTTNPNGRLSKAGTNIANLLKTKRGKVLLGGGAGLTLAGLMKNRNDNTGQLSDEEMQELYNYVYGGQ